MPRFVDLKGGAISAANVVITNDIIIEGNIISNNPASSIFSDISTNNLIASTSVSTTNLYADNIKNSISLLNTSIGNANTSINSLITNYNASIGNINVSINNMNTNLNNKISYISTNSLLLSGGTMLLSSGNLILDNNSYSTFGNLTVSKKQLQFQTISTTAVTYNSPNVTVNLGSNNTSPLRQNYALITYDQTVYWTFYATNAYNFMLKWYFNSNAYISFTIVSNMASIDFVVNSSSYNFTTYDSTATSHSFVDFGNNVYTPVSNPIFELYYNENTNTKWVAITNLGNITSKQTINFTETISSMNWDLSYYHSISTYDGPINIISKADVLTEIAQATISNIISNNISSGNGNFSGALTSSLNYYNSSNIINLTYPFPPVINFDLTNYNMIEYLITINISSVNHVTIDGLNEGTTSILKNGGTVEYPGSYLTYNQEVSVSPAQGIIRIYNGTRKHMTWDITYCYSGVGASTSRGQGYLSQTHFYILSTTNFNGTLKPLRYA